MPFGQAKRKLRVTADDFGFTPGVTDGILEAHDQGLVTHTSLMAGGLDFDRAVALARERPFLGVGIHLTLTWGKPLAAPSTIPSLMGESGRLAPLGSVLKRFIKGCLNKEEVLREWRAQADRVIRTGITPTHIDSHHHLHLLPGLLSGASQIAREFGVSWLRRPAEPLRGDFPNALVKRIMFRLLTIGAWPIPSSDAFRGLTWQGRSGFSDRLRKAIRELPPGITEFMVHPGRPDGLLEREDTYIREREIELKALIDPEIKNLVRDLDIELDRNRTPSPEMKP